MEQQEHWFWRMLRWIRDHFSSWFANSFVMMGVFLIIIASILIGMYFDGAYARRWSPEAESEDIFRNYGWLISLAMVFFTAAGVKAFQEGARFAGSVLFITGLFFTVLSATQSIGVVTLKAQKMMASADAFERIERTDTTRLDFLKSERQDLINKRDSEIARIQSSIEAIQDDGIAGIPKRDQDSIDDYNARIDVIRNEAQEKIDAKGAEIRLEMETPESSDDVEVAPARFDPGIEFWAYVLKGADATDEYKEGLTYWYMLFWSIGCPIMGQMMAVYLVITRHTSQSAKPKAQHKGKGIFKSLRDYFWNPDYKDPVRVEAGKKGAQTRKENRDADNRSQQRKLKIQNQLSSYIPAFRKAKANKIKLPEYAPSATAKYSFKCSEERMDEILRQMVKADLISQQDHDLLMDRHPPAVIPQNSNHIDIIERPSNINGKDATNV